MSSDDQLSNDEYKKFLLKQNSEDKGEKAYVPLHDTTPVGGTYATGFGWASIILFVIGLGGLITAVFLIAEQGGNRAGFVMPGDNCTVITCPSGPIGPEGPVGQIGPPGAQGIQGVTGPQGLQGVMGLPGPIGPMGECSNTNPFCLQGATGPTGLYFLILL